MILHNISKCCVGFKLTTIKLVLQVSNKIPTSNKCTSLQTVCKLHTTLGLNTLPSESKPFSRGTSTCLQYLGKHPGAPEKAKHKLKRANLQHREVIKSSSTDSLFAEHDMVIDVRSLKTGPQVLVSPGNRAVCPAGAPEPRDGCIILFNPGFFSRPHPRPLPIPYLQGLCVAADGRLPGRRRRRPTDDVNTWRYKVRPSCKLTRWRLSLSSFTQVQFVYSVGRTGTTRP